MPKVEGEMSANLGILDRLARLAIGLVLIAYAIPVWFAPASWNWVGWIGVVPLITAILGICPLCSFVGFSSCPFKRAT